MERKIIVVAPTFNEEENIAAFLKAVLAAQKNLPNWKLEILVSDSHSSDKTPEIVKQIAKKNKKVFYLDILKRGLGLGLLRGIDYATEKLGADAIVTMEADLSCNPVQLPGFLARLSKADFVVGSRYISKGKIKNWSWWRRILSRWANLILMLLALTPNIHEFTNLYRAFNKKTWQKVRPELVDQTGWLFVPAFVFVALGKNVTIIEEPIVYNDRFGGKSKMNTVSYGWELLRYAVDYRVSQIIKKS